MSRPADDVLSGRESFASSIEPWKWLEELRSGFELTFEVLGLNMEFMLPRATAEQTPDLRAAFGATPAVREAAVAMLRSPKARSLTAGDVRIRLFPLLGSASFPRPVVGFLLIGEALDPLARTNDHLLHETDRRLDASGQWLTGAIEATLQIVGAGAVESRATQRLSTMIDVVQAFDQISDERALIQLAVDAIALWFDVDVRVYRSGLSGDFVLNSWLPGSDRVNVPMHVPGKNVWGRDDVFTVGTIRYAEALTWDARFVDALIAPVIVDDAAEWLFVLPSSAGDGTIQAMLAFLARSLGQCLTRHDFAARDRIRQRMRAMLTASDPPINEVVRLALEAAASEIGATAARLAVYYGDHGRSFFTVGWGRSEHERPPYIDAGSSRSMPHEILVGTTVGRGATAVLGFDSVEAEFTASASRLAPHAADVLSSWLAGVFLGRSAMRAPIAGEYVSELVQLLRKHVDRSGRLRTDGALAAVLVDPTDRESRDLGELVKVLEKQVRASDVVGLLSERGAGVLLADVPPPAAAAVEKRLSQVARERFAPHVIVGTTTIKSFAESPETAIERAVFNARREGLS